MGKININGKIVNYTGADASNNIIKADNGKYYQKGANGYREIKQNGKSIFDSAKQKADNARKNAQAAANYNKQHNFVPNKKYYVKGNSSYFTMVDKNYNTHYYRDNQEIRKEEFLKGANCAYDARNREYRSKDLGKKLPVPKNAKRMPNSETGMYYVETKQGKRFFEENGIEISERAFLDKENAYIDSDGNYAKYDWKAKAKNAAKGISNMFADMFTSEEPIYKKDKNGRILLDRTGKPITEKNRDGSPKTNRKFSLTKTVTTVVVGAGIAAACILAAPVAAAGAAAVGIGAGAAATIGTIAGVATQLGIAGYFGYEGGKQIYEAEKENQNVLLSNNERIENWKKKGTGGAQVGMAVMMAKGSIKNAPKTHATARNTAKAIETKNNATLMTKGKVGFRDRVANARAGFSETVGKKSLVNTVKNYHRNNSFKTKVADTAKAPFKVSAKVVKEAIAEPVRLAGGVVKTGARLVTKKGRAKISGDIKTWKNSFKENPQAPAQNSYAKFEKMIEESTDMSNVRAKLSNNPEFEGLSATEKRDIIGKINKREGELDFFNNEIANMPKEADARIKKYESLIENTTDKNQVAQLLDAIKKDKELTNSQRAEVATKFFEKNDAQYPKVLENAKHQKAELGLKKAKTLDDIAQIDREALSKKNQKKFDEMKTELEKKKIKKASLEELKNIDRNTLTKEAQTAYDKRLAKLEKKAKKAENKETNSNNHSFVNRAYTGAKNSISNVKNAITSKTKGIFKRTPKTVEPKYVEPNFEGLTETKTVDGDVTTSVYKNSQGEVVYTKEVYTYNDGTPPETFLKDAQNREIYSRKNGVTPDGTYQYETRTTYDTNGFKYKENCTYYNPDGTLDLKSTSKFDTKGNRIEYSTENGKQIYEYNEKGQKIKETKTGYDVPKGEKEITTYEYDAQGDQIRYTETIGKDETVTDIVRAEDGSYRQIKSKEGIVKRVWDCPKGGKSTTYHYSKDGKLNYLYGENQIDIAYLKNGKVELTEWIEHKPQKSTITMEEFKAKFGEHVEAPKLKSQSAAEKMTDAPKTETAKPEAEKPVETPKTETAKPEAEKPVETPKAEPKANSDITKKSKNYKNFEKMVEESTDMSQIRAKLSNNPKFDKLSSAEQRQLIGKINQREALLKNTPKATNKEYDMMNWFDNVKDTTTPTLGGLNAIKWLDENYINPLERLLNSQLDPNQQYAYEEPPVQNTEEVVEIESEDDTEDQVQEGDAQAEVDNPEDSVQEGESSEEATSPEDSVENPENSNVDDNTNANEGTDENTDEKSGSDDSSATEAQKSEKPATEPPSAEQSKPAPEEPAQDSNAPAPCTVQKGDEPKAVQPAPNASATTTQRTAQQGTESESTKPAQDTNVTSTEKQNNNNTNIAQERGKTVTQNEASNDNTNTHKIGNSEERDISPIEKRNITKQVLDAKTEDDIANALQTLRDVGRFKGRKNLRRLLKAKRKQNQERVEKYEKRVNENPEATNNAFWEKLKKEKE